MRDPRVEQVLNTTANLAWEYLPTVPLSKINKTKSHANQARIDKAIDADLVRRYKDDMLRGDEFPAIVLYVDGDEYDTSDGNHRTEAKREMKQPTIDAYVVVCDDAVARQALTYEWNVLNGKAASDEDRDQHAAFLVKQGVTQKNVAERLHMPAKRVEEIVHESDGHTRAMNLGVKAPWARVGSRYARVRLHRDLTLDPTFAAAVKFASTYNLTGKQVKEFTEEINGQRTEADQLTLINTRTKQIRAEIERAKKEKSGRKTNHKGQSPRWLFEAHLAYIQKAIDAADFKPLIVDVLNDEEKKALRDRILSVKARLAEAESLVRL